MTERLGDGFTAGYDPHWDDGDDGGESAEAEAEQPRRRRWRGVVGWSVFGIALVLLVYGALAAGRSLYNPDSRIPPAPDYPLVQGLFGANQAISDELEAIEALVEDETRIELSLVGEVQRLEFPRTLLDRTLAKHKESAIFFVAGLPSGTEFRVLVLRDQSLPTVFAIELPGSRRAGQSIQGAFVVLPLVSSEANLALARLGQALEQLMIEVDEAGSSDVSNSEFTIFGPFTIEGDQSLAELIEINIVLSHLVAKLDQAGADVSVQAPAFLIFAAPETGFIRALYQPGRRLVQKPLWRAGEVPSLAHELAHAYISLVLENPDGALRSAATYFEDAHPRLHGVVVGDLYERLDSLGQAEETLAFIIGALANGQTKTIPTARLLQNEGLLAISEAVLVSDVELLISLGMLPECMDPEDLGFGGREIVHDYYAAVEAAC